MIEYEDELINAKDNKTMLNKNTTVGSTIRVAFYILVTIGSGVIADENVRAFVTTEHPNWVIYFTVGPAILAAIRNALDSDTPLY